MIGDFVTGSANRFALGREFGQPFPDDEKGRLGVEALKQFDHPRGMNRVRTVVDR